MDPQAKLPVSLATPTVPGRSRFNVIRVERGSGRESSDGKVSQYAYATEQTGFRMYPTVDKLIATAFRRIPGLTKQQKMDVFSRRFDWHGHDMCFSARLSGGTSHSPIKDRDRFSMAKRIVTAPPANHSPVGASQTVAEKRRRTLQRILDSMPAQIDTIKENRELASIELRQFMRERERNRAVKRLKKPRLNGWAKPVERDM
jgi:hypothetical protein